MIRSGDIVTVRILVTSVSPYPTKEDPKAQQVQGKMLPRGDYTGWLVPTEADVTLQVETMKVGDQVWIDKAQSRKGTVKAITMDQDSPQQLWVKPDGEWGMITIGAEAVRRV